MKKGLGKGLSALIVEQVVDEDSGVRVIEIDINKIEPNRNQPRKNFHQDFLEELAASIKQHGILQPILVREKKDYYEIIVGERRWRAARIAGLSTIPVVVKDYDLLASLEIALIENIQRENLNPMEEALSFRRLVDEFGLTQDEISKKVGKSRSVISNSMRLLNLDPRVQNFVMEDKLSNGHARALLAINDPHLQFELAERIIEEELSVRDIEHIVKGIIEQPQKKEPVSISNTDKISHKAIENDLYNLLGTKVKVSQMRNNKGRIEIEYYSHDDLDRLIGLMKTIDSEV